MKKRKTRSAEDREDETAGGAAGDEPAAAAGDAAAAAGDEPAAAGDEPATGAGHEAAAPEVTELDAPPEDEWDDPTREVDAEQQAALAVQSASEAAATASDAAAEEGRAAAGRLESVIESLLFASDRALGIAELKRLTGEREGAKLTMALEMLRSRRQDSGIQVIPVAGGWHLRTHPDNVPWVSRLVAGRPQRLSRALMETLAIVAYRQPVTRPEIDEIRGVDCGPVLGTLLERGLIRMIGKKEEVGRPILYGTTPEFLRMFSLKDLSELPTLREFHELNETEMAKVDAEAPARGAEASEAQAAGGAEAGNGASGDAPAEPKQAVPRALDPEEDDELLSELERAAGAAAKAAGAVAAASETKPTDGDEPAGSAG